MTQFDIAKSTAYFRGEFVPFSEANVSIASSPVLYGLSIYSVFGVTWNDKAQQLTIFRLKDHYQRLINSAKILDFHQFAEDWTYESFESTMLELLKQNQPQEDVLVRVTVFIDELVAGTKIHGLKNAVSAYVYSMGEILPRTGINVCISSWQRTADNAVPSRAKINGSYVNASLMKNEALLNGYDEAIALDAHGHITEGTVANVFLVKNGVLITPDTATDLLEGITRDSVITLAKEQGLECQQRTVDRSELYTADEAFMCGSSALITPILSVDKRPIGKGNVGPVTAQLTTLYKNVQTGADVRHSDWRLTIPA